MQTSFLDTDQYSLLSGTTTQHESCSSAPMTDGSQSCTCTTDMCSCSIHPNGRAEWIASMQDSLAKIFQSPAMAQALKESEAGCGEKLKGSLASYDLKSCSWKTAQQSLLEDSTLFSETWPNWGMTRNGVCYLRRQLVPRTFELGGGVLHGVPTPTRASGDKEVVSSQGGRNIVAFAKGFWATPTVHGNYNRKGMSKSSGDGLATQVRKFPTPTASMMTVGDMEQARYAGSDPKRPSYQEANRLYPTPRASDKNGHQIAPGRQGGDGLNQRIGGQLNPMWVEWLMGWPIGATELNASETDKSHSRPQPPTPCSMQD